jgi:(2R)-3-sulfolactate dehydrogenase (NADP+)
MKIRYNDAVELATGLLMDVGHNEERASVVARSLALAEAWELSSHGLLRLPTYLARTQAGGYAATAELKTVTDLGALMVLDGGTGLGHWQVGRGIHLAIPRAKQFGISAVAIGNSGHCGALGVYVADAAEAGMASILFSCGPAVLPPWGGAERLLSTSPIAAGFPLAEGPAVIDLALTTVARGKIASYALRGETLPEGWALDSAGDPTTDPHEALTGMLAPLGGAKGFALAFLVESLTAGLIGPKLSKDMPDFFDQNSLSQPQGISHLLVVFDPSRTDVNGDPNTALKRMANLASATQAAGGRVPGGRRFSPSKVNPRQMLNVDSNVLEELMARKINSHHA